MASIRDVAKLAGVSVGTVSNYLNKPSLVAPSTQKKIARIIEELDFHPSSAARSLATNRTRLLGMVVPDVMGGYFSKMLYGAEQAARQNDYDMIICSTRNSTTIELLNRFVSGRVTDGLIIVTSLDEAAADSLCRFSQQGFPFVLANQYNQSLLATCNISSILVDNSMGAYQVVEHLISHQLKRIALLSIPITPWEREARGKAYHQALTDNGIPVDPDLIFELENFSENTITGTVDKILSKEPPEGIFIMNDQVSITVMQELEKRGISVPEEIAIASFDDIEFANFITPGLTTVHQPIEAIGARSVKALIERIDNPNITGEIVSLKTNLVIRHSCGCNQS